jgi:FtsP/CotA-like multicopper oxidase with cupredoxin domain
MQDGLQDSYGGTHSVKPATINAGIPGALRYPLALTPILYHIRLKIAGHSFTNSKVRPLNRAGQFMTQADLDALGIPLILDQDGGTAALLPLSTIYGFNGTFPGPMINVDYGKPVIVRFECDLDQNPLGLDTGDFGVPQFLTHLHNGHTAPECDGQPHYMQHNEGGYIGGDYVDNLYLNWPAGGDPSETQALLWFHDHRMHHTGANVYKGMVGLYPTYDPGVEDPDNPGQLISGTGLDTGNEADPAPNPKLPGVRVNYGDGSFDVKYDIPMAFYDCRLDDGYTPHADFRIGDELILGDQPPVPPAGTDPNVCGGSHPHQWGKTFFRYHPNHGFVGDLFTVNCAAFPVLNVYKRRYRIRFLGASISRVYELAYMTSANGPVATPGIQGQYQIPDGVVWRPNGQAAMTQVACMGGLLPDAILRDLIQVWPATRNDHVVDFTNVPEGTVIYLTNVLEMPDGRKPNWNAQNSPLGYKVPMVKIIVGGAPPETDQSVMPVPPATVDPNNPTLRPMPALPTPAEMAQLPHRVFTLSRSGQFGDAAQWLINGLPFDPTQSLTDLPGPGNPGGIGSPVVNGPGEVWTLKNGGGGWVHPMHIHMEEHKVLSRVGSINIHPDDTGKSDVGNLDDSESVTLFRRFRTFTGQYVAHCHNLAHEDHNMMFGWKIVPGPTPPNPNAPKAVADTATTPMGTVVLIPILVNDTTFDGNPLAGPDGVPLVPIDEIALSGNAPFNGKVSHPLDNSGIIYTPDPGFVGTDTFSYIVTVGGVISNAAKVTVTVTAPAAPIAYDDAYEIDMNTVAILPVLANDTTFDGMRIHAVDALTLFGNAPFNGKAVVTGNTITYTPDKDYVGTNSFSYTITVGGLVSAPAKVTVTTVDPRKPVKNALAVKKAMVNTRGKFVATKGPRWDIRGSGAAPNAQVTIKTGNDLVARVQANRRGNWGFEARAVPGLTNPKTVTISSPGAGSLTVKLRVR